MTESLSLSTPLATNPQDGTRHMGCSWINDATPCHTSIAESSDLPYPTMSFLANFQQPFWTTGQANASTHRKLCLWRVLIREVYRTMSVKHQKRRQMINQPTNLRRPEKATYPALLQCNLCQCLESCSASSCTNTKRPGVDANKRDGVHCPKLEAGIHNGTVTRLSFPLLFSTHDATTLFFSALHCACYTWVSAVNQPQIYHGSRTTRQLF